MQTCHNTSKSHITVSLRTKYVALGISQEPPYAFTFAKNRFSMRSAISLFASIAALLCLTISCGGNADSDPTPVAKSFIYALHQGDYTKATNLTLMIDSAPKNYKDLIATRYKEIASEHQSQYGSIKKVVCKHTDISDDNNEADVYLTIEYSSKTVTNIVLQLSKDKGEWKIR